MSDSDLGWNVWGAVAGVLGTIALLPVIVLSFNTRLPSAKLPALLDLMKETQELFATTLREGLITDPGDLYEFNKNIWTAHMVVDELRAMVYDSKSWRQDVKNWWRGLSGRISALSEELNIHRVRLAERSSQERKLRASRGDIPLPSDHKGRLGLDSNASLATTPHVVCQPLASASQAALQVYPELCPTVHVLPWRVPSDDNDGRARRSTLDRREPPEPYGDSIGPPPYPTDRPPLATHRLISYADLDDLLSLALFQPPPASESDSGRRERAMRREVLLRFGRKLYGLDRDCDVQKDTAHFERFAERNRFEVLWRLSGRSDGERILDTQGAVTAGDSLVDRGPPLPDPRVATHIHA